jgi:hypothetical protein
VARFLTFDEDVTIIPVKGERGETQFFAAGHEIFFHELGDVYIVPGAVERDYEPPLLTEKGDIKEVHPDETPKGAVDAEIQRLALLDEARALGLDPHHLTGIPRLTKAIEEEKARLKALADEEAAAGGGSQEDDKKEMDEDDSNE